MFDEKRYPHVALYRKEVERLKTSHPEYYRNRICLLRVIVDFGMEDQFDMYCTQAIAEAGRLKVLQSWTSLMTKRLQEHEYLFKHRNIALRLL
jgi:hypothetical protein